MTCERCKKRGKTWNGGDPVCAFEGGMFSDENWNCATMNELRALVEDRAVWNEDNNAAILPLKYEPYFLFMGWYKSRGRTDYVGVFDGSRMSDLRLKDAEEILNQYSKGSAE